MTKKTSNTTGVTQGQIAADFDRITEDYEETINQALAFTGREHSFFINVKRDEILRQAQSHFGDVSALEVLDHGCGIGAYHEGLKGAFGSLHGVDVSERSIELARRKHSFVTYAHYDGRRLPYDDERFDIVFAICVMHHVPRSNWSDFVAEMARVLKKGGLALVFEHNPINPATQYIVKTCEIDKDAVLLWPGGLRRRFAGAGFEDIRTRTILSVPPVGRLLSAADGLLGRLPFGAQYYLAAVRPG
ncbi:class I SAM-dependent methyltransferase [Roseitalea porphyridii]|uniref:Class I SAM-dependent methyltransferase n=1 Tax=Roseitalea porphyridii TaxID=1852022 RepID=A0A4P6V0F7_9HYPH|nr:class I SAM-dependent methyltransferase [Roseitalea porphyridii]QBK30812.1 class I SAM-dependent methyltransferase [Roseitalea porphyridii]